MVYIDREKVAKLPVWAKELIQRLEYANEPMVQEVAKLRKENQVYQERSKRLSESNEALITILKCAGKGGSDIAALIVKTLEEYEIFRDGDK